MLNLHAPFRFATPDDVAAINDLSGESPSNQMEAEGTVLADEGGRISAVLSGRPAGEIWQVVRLAAAPERFEELGFRILAIADALAAEEGLGTVGIDAARLSEEWRSLLDQEGFRSGEAGQGAPTLTRPVIPQG